MYTKSDFGRDLNIEINKNFDVIRIAKWAYKKYSDISVPIDPDLKKFMMIIIAMEEGKEFQRSKEELLKFSAELQK